MTSEPLIEEDVTVWTTILRHAYGTATLTPVLVADGYNVTVAVRDNRLVITDGVGSHGRTRTLHRSDRTVRRIVLIGRAGSVTLAALRWCTEVGISVAMIDLNGALTAVTATPNPNDARLRRSQALAYGTNVGNGLARQLISMKLAGQAEVLAGLDARAEARALASTADDIAADDTLTLDRVREIEAVHASIYFSRWVGRVSAQFATRERHRVPETWLTMQQRKSRITAGRSSRTATDPVNAILNYAYALGEALCRQACIVVGLDPALGVMHTDKAHRDSMALDLLETLRPTIDAHVIDTLAARRFRRIDFIETAVGQCQLTESVTHHLTAAMPVWAAKIAPTAEDVAHTIGDAAEGRLRRRTPLTQRNKLDARTNPAPRRGVKLPQSVRAVTTCRECGTPLADRRRKLCSDCWPAVRRALAEKRAAAGRAARQMARDRSGVDPTQSVTAQERRSASLRAERAARDAWDAQHARRPAADRDAYVREVMPELRHVPLREIVAALGVSESAASRMRSGKLVPHPRHWASLQSLIERTN